MPEVLWIGCSDALTARLVADLAQHPEIGDCRAATPGDDLASLAGESAFDTVVYAARDPRGWPDLATAGRSFEILAGCGIRHLILLSSAEIHEPNAHHQGLLSESRTSPRRTGNAIPGLWRDLEQRASEAMAGGEAVLTVLRPPTILDPQGGGLCRLFSRGWLAVTVAGYDPCLQLLSAGDLSAAVARAALSSRGGVYHVAPAGVMPLSETLRAAGKRRLGVPLNLQRAGRKLRAVCSSTQTAGRSSDPPAASDPLDYLRYPWTVSGEKIARELDFRPTRSSAEAVREFCGEGSAPPAPEYDDFGMDKRTIAALGRTLFRFLHDVYWRVEVRGLEHVPARGRALLAGVHRGHQPWDGVMALHLLVRELGRYPRFLVHPALLKHPFLAPYMIKCGGIPACRENAAWVLRRDELLAIFPEGIRGAFTRYRDAYKLGRFGRDEFVKIALRQRAPIVPFVTVGSAEIFPILGKIKWRWWQRWSEWPCLPITPTMSLLPLPSKWHTRFLAPIHVEERYGPEAAGDRSVVRSISLQVRERMEEAIAEMLRRRKSIFYGALEENP